MFLPSFSSLLVSTLCVTGSVLAKIPEGEPTCEAARTWVEENAANLPSDYKTFSQYSPTYRRAILQKLDNEVVGGFWASHFDSYISQHPDLSPEKLALIRESGDFLNLPDRDEEVMNGLEERIKQVFERDEAMALFAQLGEDGEEQQGQVRRQVSPPDCTCSVGSWFSCWSCHDTNQSCNESLTGCGFYISYPCNGWC